MLCGFGAVCGEERDFVTVFVVIAGEFRGGVRDILLAIDIVSSVTALLGGILRLVGRVRHCCCWNYSG